LSTPQRAHLDELGKAAREQVAMRTAERAQRVVIGVRLRAQEPHRDVLVSGPLNLPAGEDAGGITIDEQPEHHARRIVRIAGAAFIDARALQVQLAERIHDEMRQMIGGHPIAPIGRQEQRRVVLDVDEAGSHAPSTRNLEMSGAESPTGC
jgi:hypothetical protein